MFFCCCCCFDFLCTRSIQSHANFWSRMSYYSSTPIGHWTNWRLAFANKFNAYQFFFAAAVAFVVAVVGGFGRVTVAIVEYILNGTLFSHLLNKHVYNMCVCVFSLHAYNVYIMLNKQHRVRFAVYKLHIKWNFEKIDHNSRQCKDKKNTHKRMAIKKTTWKDSHVKLWKIPLSKAYNGYDYFQSTRYLISLPTYKKQAKK